MANRHSIMTILPGSGSSGITQIQKSSVNGLWPVDSTDHRPS